MEYIETTIGKVAKYNQYLESWTQKELPQNYENEELLAVFRKFRQSFEMIGKLYYPNNPYGQFLPELLNEFYTSLRKINYSLTDFKKSSLFSKDKGLKDVKGCLTRTLFFIDEYHSAIKKFYTAHQEEIPADFNPGKVVKNAAPFLLSIKNQVNSPMSCENIFVNMVQYKDMVYYVETNDIFSFFYFYRTDECWFWSPPKKTDPEDIWIECPDVKITEGYWTHKVIPPFMADYIRWLDFFFPNIPEFYIKKEDIIEGKPVKDKKNEEQANEQKKDCVIY